MSIEVILAAAAVALSIPLLWYSIASSRSQANTLELAPDGRQMADMRQLILEQGAGQRLVTPGLRTLAYRLRELSPIGRIQKLDRRIELAGITHSWSVDRVLLLKFFLAAGMVLLALGPLRSMPRAIVVLPTLVLIAYFLPNAVISNLADKRQAVILRELPDTLDQVTMAVEAGMGFEGAVDRVAAAGHGPLSHELLRFLREMQLGVSRTEALRNLGDRTDVDDLRSFVFAIIQSENYGLPIAQVLRVQASDLRDKRRSRAEERALKLPVLLIFPLAFGIFPAIFIVLLGPAAIRIFRDLGPAIS
ncbi:MAG: type II secretion system F family protein [Acidimicrobiia bacterium]|nr:type II secretion system F family protein [Acidimicrobiia bacterium]